MASRSTHDNILTSYLSPQGPPLQPYPRPLSPLSIPQTCASSVSPTCQVHSYLETLTPSVLSALKTLPPSSHDRLLSIIQASAPTTSYRKAFLEGFFQNTFSDHLSHNALFQSHITQSTYHYLKLSSHLFTHPFSQQGTLPDVFIIHLNLRMGLQARSYFLTNV